MFDVEFRVSVENGYLLKSIWDCSLSQAEVNNVKNIVIKKIIIDFLMVFANIFTNKITAIV